MIEKLKHVFKSISPITEADWQMLEPNLRVREYKKNDYYLSSGQIEHQIAFIIKGSFKWYYIDNMGEEINYHFFFDNNFVVEFNVYSPNAGLLTKQQVINARRRAQNI